MLSKLAKFSKMLTKLAKMQNFQKCKQAMSHFFLQLWTPWRIRMWKNNRFINNCGLENSKRRNNHSFQRHAG